MAEFTVRYKSIWVDEKFSGKQCSICQDDIYGDGVRLVLMVYPIEDPTYKETDLICCASCGEALKFLI